MARLELPPSSLLLLTPAGDDEDLSDDARFNFTTVDTFRAVHLHEQDSENGARYSVDISQLIQTGDTRVCRGTLSVDGRRHTEVVCKIGRGRRCVESLHREAALYRGKLAPLQGHYVPTFIGLFDGQTAEGETSCLILSYEGEVMQQSLYFAGIEFRKKVVDALLALHKVGIRHGAFSEASIVVRSSDNSPILVGFGHAENDHCCHLGVDIVFYKPQPHNEEVACEEIYWACVIAAVWLPATVEFLNTQIPIQWALGGYDALVAHAPKGTDPDLACMHAELTREDLLEWIEERELYDGQPLPVKIVD